jgi:hypothetical protein
MDAGASKVCSQGILPTWEKNQMEPATQGRVRNLGGSLVRSVAFF